MRQHFVIGTRGVMIGALLLALHSAPARATDYRPGQSGRTFDSVKGKHSLTLGINAGTTYYYPTLHFQQAFSKHLTVGLMALYFDFTQDTTRTVTWGGFLTMSWYAKELFRGLWLQGGAGNYWFRSTTSQDQENVTSMAGFATIGWRGKWDGLLNIGVAAGGLYVQTRETTSINLRFNGLLPLFLIDFGWTF